MFNSNSQTRLKRSSSQRLTVLLAALTLVYVQMFSLGVYAKDSTQLDDRHIALNSYKHKLSSLKHQTDSITQKISVARKKEKLALAKLQKTQRELFKVQSSFLLAQRKLSSLQNEIDSLNAKIGKVELELKAKSQVLRKHLRHIYIHRGDFLATMVEAVFSAVDFNELLSIIHLQQRLVRGELNLLDVVRSKQQALINLKSASERHKQELTLTFKESERLKNAITVKKQEQYDLVERLRKERLTYEAAERELERESNDLTSKILKLTGRGGFNVGELAKGAFGFPVKAAITSPFGFRIHPIFRVRSFHSGIDFGAHMDVPVKASNGGSVIYSGWYSGYGKTVIVSHGGEKSTLYAHLNRISVKTGDQMAKGDILGYVGRTGLATGPHLHFEYREDGKPQNPMTVIN